MSARTVKLAVIPGDGIGPEVVAEGLKVLSAVAPRHGLTLDTTEYELGAQRWHATGEVLPDAVEEELRQHDAILLGAVGDPTVPSGVLERGLLLRLRFNFSHVNLRPVRLLPGGDHPAGRCRTRRHRHAVVREGMRALRRHGRRAAQGHPHEIATQDSVNTRLGVERVVRYAFAKAAERPCHKLTLVHKDNVLTYAGELWQRVVREVGAEYPQVEVDYLHVDAATMFFVTQPRRFDVVVTDNLFGDIITDLGAAVAGGIGLAASGNINPEGDFPSMFEPVHGSAPDIAGQGKADPTATILSVSLMLEHLGYADAAAQIDQAVAEDLQERAKNGGVRSTTQIGDDIAQRVAEQG